MFFNILSSITTQQRSIARQAMFALILLAGVIILMCLGLRYEPPLGLWIGLAGLLVSAGVYLMLICAIPGYVFSQASKQYGDYLNGQAKQSPSPWAWQFQLMQKSDQEMPTLPCLTNGSLLYAALIMEECSEKYLAIVRVLNDYLNGQMEIDAEAGRVGRADMIMLRNMFADTSGYLHQKSLQIRSKLKVNDVGRIAITRDQARELLDGNIDISVVNCGFALATGLPAEAGYDEVQASNLSKANPDTGVIDKDPSGKWIKGRDFRLPNLDYILDMQRQGHAWSQNVNKAAQV
jgi:hypothetical protein